VFQEKARRSPGFFHGASAPRNPERYAATSASNVMRTRSARLAAPVLLMMRAR
jgi:hypothetical protein